MCYEVVIECKEVIRKVRKPKTIVFPKPKCKKVEVIYVKPVCFNPCEDVIITWC